MTTMGHRLAALLAGLGVGLSCTTGLAAALTLTSQRFTPYRTCTLTAYPATTPNDADATVQQALPSTNFGASASLTVASGSGANQRVYLQFSLSACNPVIPSTAIVRLGTLRLFTTLLPAVCRTEDLFAVPSTWTETAITWNNQPFGTGTNNPPTASRSGVFSVGSPAGCQNRVVNAYIAGPAVTTDVQAFVAGSQSNFGWMIRDDAENSGTVRTATFASKDAGQVAQAPQLVITYVSVP
jgi:hypothetical protein